MALNGQTEARKLRSRLSHPVVDADGHWLEYLPVMREQFKKIAGDAAVEGLALASSRIPNALKLSLAERRRKRVGMEGFWSSPRSEEHTSELQSPCNLVCRLLLEKKKTNARDPVR